jgi:hypothetical protein
MNFIFNKTAAKFFCCQIEPLMLPVLDYLARLCDKDFSSSVNFAPPISDLSFTRVVQYLTIAGKAFKCHI